MPTQSRDATLASRYFPHPPSTPASTGKVLVPSSSPLGPEATYQYHQHSYQPHTGDVASGSTSSTSLHQSPPSYGYDPLSAPSGYTSNSTSTHASFSRPLVSNGHATPPIDIPGRGEPPRKRINRGPSESPPDPIDLFRIQGSPDFQRPVPGSPEVQRPGQRRRLNTNHVVSSASDDESVSETARGLAGPSKPRIVRGHPPKPEPLSSEPSQSDIDEEKFKTWKFTQPIHSVDVARAAWKQAGGDERKADALLSDPNWKAPSLSPSKPTVRSVETGRVKEVVEANKAERARMREMGKKSMIYQSRPTLDGKPVSKSGLPTITPPASRATIDLTASPVTPGSPAIALKKPKRLKRKILESDSEPEIVEVDSDVEERRPTPPSSGPSTSKKTLDYFNTASAEALMELSGMSDFMSIRVAFHLVGL